VAVDTISALDKGHGSGSIVLPIVLSGSGAEMLQKVTRMTSRSMERETDSATTGCGQGVEGNWVGPLGVREKSR